MILLDVNQVCNSVSQPVSTGQLVQHGRIKLPDALQVVAELIVVPRLVGPHPHGRELVRIDTLNRSKIVIVYFTSNLFDIKGVKVVSTPRGLIAAFSYTFTYPMVDPWERRAGRYRDPSSVFRILHDTVEAFAMSAPQICGRSMSRESTAA